MEKYPVSSVNKLTVVVVITVNCFDAVFKDRIQVTFSKVDR